MSDDTTPFDELDFDSASLDEILYHYGFDPVTEWKKEAGYNRVTIHVEFADFSKLTVTAEIPILPQHVLSEGVVISTRLATGEREEVPDRGFTEQMDLAQQATAYRVLSRIFHDVLATLPERESRPCPDCEDGFASSSVVGTIDVADDAPCPTCKRRGIILRGIDYDD